MKRLAIFFAACLLTGDMVAQSVNSDEKGFLGKEQDMTPLSPTFLDGVYENSGWGDNWFLGIQGGMSAFLGKPVGHGDFFDRTQPLFNAYLGKWFTPYWAGRLSFQGFKLKDMTTEARTFQNVHADIMYNISSHFRNGFDELPKWDFIPYAGCGIIRNTFSGRKPFAISYGFIGRYRLAPHLHISGEIGGTTTWQSFDGIGADDKLGDNLLHASLGLTVTIGHDGFRQVIDADPYITQNDILMNYISDIEMEKSRILRESRKNAMALSEMRKILEIEGLLDKYNLALSEEEQKALPKNNYSGLNSLRARLRNKGWNEDANRGEVNFAELTDNFSDTSMGDSVTATPEQYFRAAKDGNIYVGTPVFFFFKLAKAELTEQAQMINLKEVAMVCKRYGLSARIVGAADSQTGTAYANERLSMKRAEYIAQLLKDQGVSEERIKTQYRGGINSYEPTAGNRNTCVMLFAK